MVGVLFIIRKRRLDATRQVGLSINSYLHSSSSSIPFHPFTLIAIDLDWIIVRPIVPPQPHVDWRCPQCKSNTYSQLSDIRRLNKNTAIVTLSFHNEADDAFFKTVNDLHTRNPLSGLMNNIGAYWFQLKQLEQKDISTIAERVLNHFMPWETMDQLIVEIQAHTMNGLGGFADAKMVTIHHHHPTPFPLLSFNPLQ